MSEAVSYTHLDVYKRQLKYNAEGNLLSVNLDIKNPNSAETLEHLPPEQLAEDIIKKERRILELMEEIKAELGRAEA